MAPYILKRASKRVHARLSPCEYAIYVASCGSNEAHALERLEARGLKPGLSLVDISKREFAKMYVRRERRRLLERDRKAKKSRRSEGDVRKWIMNKAGRDVTLVLRLGPSFKVVMEDVVTGTRKTVSGYSGKQRFVKHVKPEDLPESEEEESDEEMDMMSQVSDDGSRFGDVGLPAQARRNDVSSEKLFESMIDMFMNTYVGGLCAGCEPLLIAKYGMGPRKMRHVLNIIAELSMLPRPVGWRREMSVAYTESETLVFVEGLDLALEVIKNTLCGCPFVTLDMVKLWLHLFLESLRTCKTPECRAIGGI
jgi:hypothetical protein